MNMIVYELVRHENLLPIEDNDYPSGADRVTLTECGCNSMPLAHLLHIIHVCNYETNVIENYSQMSTYCSSCNVRSILFFSLSGLSHALDTPRDLLSS